MSAPVRAAAQRIRRYQRRDSFPQNSDQYPANTTALPPNLTDQEICSRYPNHIHGQILNMAHRGFFAPDIYKHVPANTKRERDKDLAVNRTWLYKANGHRAWGLRKRKVPDAAMAQRQTMFRLARSSHPQHQLNASYDPTSAAPQHHSLQANAISYATGPLQHTNYLQTVPNYSSVVVDTQSPAATHQAQTATADIDPSLED